MRLAGFCALVCLSSTLACSSEISPLNSDQTGSIPYPAAAVAAPGTVHDLTLPALTDTSATVTFTEVGDGTSEPASYELRYAANTIDWTSAATSSRGSCATPVAGQGIGNHRTCTAAGLTPSTRYEFQIVAFRGALDVNPAFGPVSRAVAGITAAAAVVAVASVTVSPSPTVDTVGKTRQYQATILDANANLLSGRPVTWTSSDNSVMSVDASGLATAKNSGTATVTATSEGKSGSVNARVVPPAVWGNEPAGFTTISDNPFDALDVLGWGTSWNDNGYVRPAIDAVRGNVLQFNYPSGFTGSKGPGMEYLDHAPARDAYAGFWWKASNPWQGHPTGVNKIAFWVPQTSGTSVDMQMYGSPPYRMDVVSVFPAGGMIRMGPNVTQSPVTLGVWHKLEWHIKYATTSSSADGIVEWWMDDVLQGRYTNVQTPNDAGFIEYQFSPTWGGEGGLKTENDWFMYDSVHLSKK
jgi:uncharacterized protein YjdB